jgi:hypothetical protein
MAQFSHAASGGDWEDVDLADAIRMVAAGKWYECQDCDYDDGERNFHCHAPCEVCDKEEEG